MFFFFVLHASFCACVCVILISIYFFLFLFLIHFLLKHNCFTEFCFFSVKPQNESAIGIRIFPPF